MVARESLATGSPLPNPLTFRLRLAALVIGVFLIGANSFILSPILSDVAASLNTTAVPITWSISAFGGATGLSAFFLGKKKKFK